MRRRFYAHLRPVRAMLAIAVVLALADYLSTRLVATAGQQVVFAIRSELFGHLEAQGDGFRRVAKADTLHLARVKDMHPAPIHENRSRARRAHGATVPSSPRARE